MNRTFQIARRFLVAFLCLGLISLGPIPHDLAGQEPAPKNKSDESTSVWMKKKLEYSQNILAGLATADFDKIASNAEAMQGLSKIEGFVRSRTPGYRAQLHQFEHANSEILANARKDNVDGATIAFTQLTISCVNCHKYLRETMRK